MAWLGGGAIFLCSDDCSEEIGASDVLTEGIERCEVYCRAEACS